MGDGQKSMMGGWVGDGRRCDFLSRDRSEGKYIHERADNEIGFDIIISFDL